MRRSAEASNVGITILQFAGTPRVANRDGPGRELRLRHRRRGIGGLRSRLSAHRRSVGPRAASGGRRARHESLDPHPDRARQALGAPHVRLGLRHGARAPARRSADRGDARQGARRQLLDQRDGLRARPPRRLRSVGAEGVPRLVVRRNPPLLQALRNLGEGREHLARWPRAALRHRFAESGPLFDAWLDAAREADWPFTEDYNGMEQEGFGRSQWTIKNGRRCSAAVAFLRPAMRRPNLTVETNALATRVILERTRATGVEYARTGRLHQASTTREVLLAGGVFNTPQLLMLSGIGEADHLREVGIEPRVSLPGVGKNLQDHLSVDVHHARRGRGPFHAEMRLDRAAVNIARPYVLGTRPGTVLPSRLHAFLKTRRELAVPDIQFLFRGAPARAYPWFPGITPAYEDSFGLRPVMLHPESRGVVRLRSADPAAPVRIVQNFLATENDVRTIREGVKLGRDIASARGSSPSEAARRRQGPPAAPTPRSTRSCAAPRSPLTTHAPPARWESQRTRCWIQRCACEASRRFASPMPRPCPIWSPATSTPAC